METARLLALNGSDEGVCSAKNASLGRSATSEKILTGVKAVMIVALRAIWTETHTEQFLENHFANHSETIGSCEWIPGKDGAPLVVLREHVLDLSDT
jgi:hypothetical protein